MSFIKDSCLEVATALRHARGLRRRGGPESDVRALIRYARGHLDAIIDDMRAEGVRTLDMHSPRIAEMEAALEAMERPVTTPGVGARAGRGNTDGDAVIAPDHRRSEHADVSMVVPARAHLGILINLLQHRR